MPKLRCLVINPRVKMNGSKGQRLHPLYGVGGADSGTITDASGRTSGQTVEAFWNFAASRQPIVSRLKLRFGCKRNAPAYPGTFRKVDGLLAYPNAGLPNEFGQYDETAHETAHQVDDFIKSGLVNIVGGCCGTTPEHIKCIAEKAAKYSPGAHRSWFIYALKRTGSGYHNS